MGYHLLDPPYKIRRRPSGGDMLLLIGNHNRTLCEETPSESSLQTIN
jgi:hypothetical protein